MSTTFAILTSHPGLLGCQLARLEPDVQLPGGRAFNAVGVGSYAQEDVLLQRQPAQDGPVRLTSLTPYDASEALLFHAHQLPAHLSLDQSGQPFRFRRWLFTVRVTLPGFESFQAQVEASLPPFLQRQIGAETPEEACFATFLRVLRDAGRTDDSSVGAAQAAAWLGEAARFMASASRKSGAARAAELTLVATNARVLVAARLGGPPLFYTLVEGTPHCERCAEHVASEPLRRAHERSRAFAFSTSLAPSARWLELASGDALGVGQDFKPVQLPLASASTV